MATRFFFDYSLPNWKDEYGNRADDIVAFVSLWLILQPAATDLSSAVNRGKYVAMAGGRANEQRPPWLVQSGRSEPFYGDCRRAANGRRSYVTSMYEADIQSIAYFRSPPLLAGSRFSARRETVSFFFRRPTATNRPSVAERATEVVVWPARDLVTRDLVTSEAVAMEARAVCLINKNSVMTWQQPLGRVITWLPTCVARVYSLHACSGVSACVQTLPYQLRRTVPNNTRPITYAKLAKPEQQQQQHQQQNTHARTHAPTHTPPSPPYRLSLFVGAQPWRPAPLAIMPVAGSIK